MNKKVIYCGSIPKVADELIVDQNLDVQAIISQSGTVSNDMLFLSYLRDIPVIEVNSKQALEDAVEEFSNLDALVICGFGIILTSKLLSKVPAYNFHPGKLPDYKGRHPTFFATVAGETNIGMTLHEVTPEIDAGKIFDIEMIPYGYRETEADLSDKFHTAIRSMLPTLVLALNGEIRGESNVGGKYYKPVSKEDKTFTATDSPSHIINIVRAQAKYDGGIFAHQGREFWVSSVNVDDIEAYFILENMVFYHQNLPVGIKLKDSKYLAFQSVKVKED